MIDAYLALGSNLGDRVAHLQFAVDELARTGGITVRAVSGVYETDPVGGPAQGDYLNAVVAVATTLDPYSLLDRAHAIEAAAERVRNERFGPRTLDVDVLLYGDCRLDDPTLTIPHPRMWERDFVCVPLADVAPDRVAGREHPPASVRRTDAALELRGPS